MIKSVVSLLVVLVLTVIVSTVWDVRPDDFFLSAIFTVSGILFSVGMGLIVTFNPNRVKNRVFLNELRRSIKHVRNLFLANFFFIAIYYIINQYVVKKQYELPFNFQVDISFSFPIFLCLMILYSCVFFIVNSIEIQRIKNEIFDAINKELP